MYGIFLFNNFASLFKNKIGATAGDDRPEVSARGFGAFYQDNVRATRVIPSSTRWVARKGGILLYSC